MENYELGYRKNVKTNSSSLSRLNYQKSNARNKIKASQKQNSTSTKGLMKDLMKEI